MFPCGFLHPKQKQILYVVTNQWVGGWGNRAELGHLLIHSYMSLSGVWTVLPLGIWDRGLAGWFIILFCGFH